MTTYRERRENKAERLREWADKRVAKASARDEIGKEYRHDWAFVTQPGHIPARAAMNRRDERSREDRGMAASMDRRASGIEDQLDRAIYSDDPDAAEALTSRIAELEAKRDAMKVRNAAYRKANGPALKALTLYFRNEAMPHPTWEVSNLTANITRNKKRLEALASPRKYHGLIVRYGGPCNACGKALEKGDWAGYNREEKTLRCGECYQKPRGQE